MKGQAPRLTRPAVRLAVRIDEVAPRGDGVAHVVVSGERRAVFVPQTAVGDELEVSVDLSSRPARGAVLKLLSPGPERVAPPCAFVEACRACDWMHLSEAAQSETRAEHLRKVLPESFRSAPVTLHPAQDPLRYRTRARVHVRATRGRVLVGFHAAGTHDVIPVTACIILHPALDHARAQIGALLEGAHGHGEAHLALGTDGKPVLELRWQGAMPARAFGKLDDAVTSGAFAGAAVYLGEVTRPAILGDPRPRMTGADGEPLVLASGGFAQASEAGNLLLGQRVRALAGVLMAGGSDVLELYAGAGNFTVLLARDFGRVIAVESSPVACAAARDNLAARGLKARVTEANAETFALPRAIDLVVLDPPRTGARQVCTALAASTAKAVLYVSCDTSTLGRDLGIVADRFTAVAIESLAMFPQTSHAETLVALARKPRP